MTRKWVRADTSRMLAEWAARQEAYDGDDCTPGDSAACSPATGRNMRIALNTLRALRGKHPEHSTAIDMVESLLIENAVGQ